MDLILDFKKKLMTTKKGSINFDNIAEVIKIASDDTFDTIIFANEPTAKEFAQLMYSPLTTKFVESWEYYDSLKAFETIKKADYYVDAFARKELRYKAPQNDFLLENYANLRSAVENYVDCHRKGMHNPDYVTELTVERPFIYKDSSKYSKTYGKLIGSSHKTSSYTEKTLQDLINEMEYIQFFQIHPELRELDKDEKPNRVIPVSSLESVEYIAKKYKVLSVTPYDTGFETMYNVEIDDDPEALDDSEAYAVLRMFYGDAREDF